MTGTTAEPKPLLPVVQEFKDYLERFPDLHSHFRQMWRQENKLHYPGHTTIGDYNHMFQALNDAMQHAPEWSSDAHRVGSAGLPFCDIFYYAVATPSGYRAFTDAGVAKMLKKLLCAWGSFLTTSESAAELPSWLTKTGGLDALVAAANAPYGTNLTFEELFDCDPTSENYGFKSWDHFFTRKFRHGVRPIASPGDDHVVANACESKRYNLQHNVQLEDKFWIKGCRYSLADMLQKRSVASLFEMGTVYQAFLSTYSYHRWHAPVSGYVRLQYSLEGTYFTIPAFDSMESRAHRKCEMINPEEWQGWLSAVGTRAVILIEADNPALGVVGFVAIGMVEVSTVEITVTEGQHINKGDQMGTFHFGGSSQCLLFQNGVTLSGFPPAATENEQNFPVGAAVATIDQSASAPRKRTYSFADGASLLQRL